MPCEAMEEGWLMEGVTIQESIFFGRILADKPDVRRRMLLSNYSWSAVLKSCFQKICAI